MYQGTSSCGIGFKSEKHADQMTQFMLVSPSCIRPSRFGCSAGRWRRRSRCVPVTGFHVSASYGRSMHPVADSRQTVKEQANTSEEATNRISNMPPQPLLPILMHRMPLGDLPQTIPHQKLIVSGRENSGGDINQDGDPAVVEVSEGFAAEENGGHDPGAEIAGEVRADGDVGEAPDHGCVGEADGEGGAGGGDERVGWVEVRPDDEADEAINEEFSKEEVAEVSV